MIAVDGSTSGALGLKPQPRHARIRAMLEFTRLPVYLALLALALGIPSLFIGWQMDDYAQRAMLVGAPTENKLFHSRYQIFTLGNGSPEGIRIMADEGFAPWWTYERMVLSFLRPITVLTHDFDYHVFSGPMPMHAHNMLWYAGLVLAAALLYRRFIQPAWVAGMAALLFTIDDAHGWPLVWIANRNALVSGFLGVLALIAHDRWRRDGWRAGAIVGPVLLLLCLFSAEAGVAACAYLFAYQVCADRGSMVRRFAGFAPYLAAGAVWFAVYRQGNYGTYGSYFYIDPVRETARYLSVLPERALILLLGQWALPPASSYLFLNPVAIKVLALAAGVVLTAFSWQLVPLIRSSAVNRFWLLGMLLSILPVANPVNGSIK